MFTLPQKPMARSNESDVKVMHVTHFGIIMSIRQKNYTYT